MLTRIGKYTIESEIGRGGFGQVYRAYDPSVGRSVAIKVLKPDADQSVLSRFRNEAMAAGNLQHKNIVTVYEFGEQDGLAYLVMQYLEGRDLQRVVKEESLTLLQKVQIMSQVASGLHYAHMHGVVHRDVKPANIMVLPDGTVKIMDFGIARLLYVKGATQTQAGFMIGSLLYMSPEQFGSGPIDALCDIWAYGVIYYELITGRHPFPAGEPAAAMYMIQRIEPSPVRELAPGCPQGIADIITRALAKERELRYQSLEDVRLDAEPILLQLQREEADALARKAQEMAERGDWEAVQATVKQILDLDSTNAVARQLREAMRQRSKRQSIRPRVDALVKQGIEQLSMRQFRAAIDAFESALRLDETDSAIRSRLAEANSRLEHSRKAAELVRNAKVDLDARSFTTAFELASEALRLDPQNPDALATLSIVRAEAERRDAQVAVQQGLEQARGLLLLQSFDEALGILNTLKSRYPPTDSVERALAEIEQQKLEHERRGRLRAYIEASKELLKRGAAGDAVNRLQAALIDFPEDRELQQLLSYAGQQVESQRRAEALERVRAEAQRLMDAQDYDAALQALEIALKAHPGEPGLIALLQTAVAGKAAQRRENAIVAAIRRAEQEARQNRLTEALEVITQAAGEYPDDARLPTIRERLGERLRQMERSTAIHKAVSEAQDLLKAKDPGRAIAVLESSIARFPDSEDLRRVREAAQREKAEQDEQRAVMSALDRARRLEQEEQWAAAFGVITAALRAYPDSDSLRGTEDRLRKRMDEEERRYAATRERADIEDLIAGRRYSDALDRIERARKANPSDESFAQQIKRVRSLIREECDRYASRIRATLAAGDLMQAEELLLEGLRVVPGEDTLLALKREIELERECRQLVLTARTQLESGEFDSAERSARQALKSRPEDPPAREVLRQVEIRRADQDRRRRIEHARKNVRDLLAKRRFQDARKFLNAAMKNFPDATEFHTDLDQVETAERQYNEQEQREAEIARLLKLQRSGDAQEVLKGARQMLAASPGEAHARELVSWAEQTIAQARQEREQSISQGCANARLLSQQGRFGEARAGLNALLKRFPDALEPRSELAAVDTAEQQRREREHRDAEITSLFDLKKAGNAKEVLAGATQLLARVPDESRARELAGWANQAIAEAEARAAQEKAQRESLERERAEHARRDREAAERAERTRLEQERAERERLERERLARTSRKMAAAAEQSYSGPAASDSQALQSPFTGTSPEMVPARAGSKRARTATWITAASLAVLLVVGWVVWGRRPPPPPPAATIEVDTASITESTQATTPIHKTIQVRSTTPRSFAVAPTAAWLHVSSSSSQTPAVLDIDIDPATLSAGSYVAEIELRGANGAPERNIPVHLTVSKPEVIPPTNTTTTSNPPSPTLSVSTTELRFECEAASAACEVQHIAIATNGAPISFQAKEPPNAGWLSVNPHGGRTPATLAVSVSARSLKEGNYSGAFTVKGPDKASGEKTVRVDLTVRPAKKVVPGPVTTTTQPPPGGPSGTTDTTKPVNTTPPGGTTPKGPYGGRPTGRIFWYGTLAPHERIVCTPDGVQGPGAANGNYLPGEVDVEIETTPPDLARKEVPSAANGYSRLVLENASNAPIKNITIRWSVKSPK